MKIMEIDIKPKKICHHTIIHACDTTFNKHPDHLLKEEVLNFNNDQNGNKRESHVSFHWCAEEMSNLRKKCSIY